MSEQFYVEIIDFIKQKNPSKEELHKEKLRLTKKYGVKKIPTDIDIVLHMSNEDRKTTNFKAKPMRSQSGVCPVTIMCAPFACPHGACTYCPNHIKEGIPMSYTGKEPASMRGLRWNFDAYLQTFNRLEQYVALGHIPQKCEVIINGGTMPSFPIKYQVTFIEDMFKALNDFGELFFSNGELDVDQFKKFFLLPGDINDLSRQNIIKDRMLKLKEKNRRGLSYEQTRNEHSFIRCIGLTFETRPDCGLLPHGNLLLKLGATRIELGIQSVYDDVLQATNRCHSSETSKKSIQILRDLGFKLNFHVMPGQPGLDKKRISYERDLEGLKTIFSDPAYRPDMLKIYPCMVMPQTPLFEDYKKGIFTPMSTNEAIKLLHDFLPLVPEYCRIMRVQRDIPTYRISAGVDKTNLRQLTGDVKVRDIRAREVKDQIVNTADVKILVRKYEASNGIEFFISAEDTKQDLLLGFCRMRFPSEFLRPEITSKTALIRELHVYGFATKIGDDGITQHRGWGSKLLLEAERIAREHNKNKMVIISGVGVREYYIRKHNYSHDGPYVSKIL